MMKYHQLFVRVLGIVTLCALHGWNNRQVSLVPKVYNYCFERIFVWGERRRNKQINKLKVQKTNRNQTQPHDCMLHQIEQTTLVG